MNVNKGIAYVLGLLIVICVFLGINYDRNAEILRKEFISLKRGLEDKKESKETEPKKKDTTEKKDAKNNRLLAEVPEKKEAPAVAFPLDVPLVNQMDNPRLYNGCEIASLTMVMQFHGIDVTKNELAEAIERVPLNYADGKHGNPNVGFVGDMENGPGLGVYHGPIMKLAEKYVGERARDLTGNPFETIQKELDKGLPVWVITTANFGPVGDFKKWETPQGPIEVTYSEHSVALTGYDEQNVYLNDPYGVKNRKVNKEQFIQSWNQMGKQAVVIDKAE
ncbi:C39 family peptidase [Falsibacillus pallidus]|uniref:C39 family peptidase n=1 Tax=Falsibacillus pallidus TaxID=493781 RepID=UPI003D9739DD